MFSRFKRQRQLRQQADGVYVALVAQARTPAFYVELAVPDSFDGRFELVVLHVYALTRGLAGRAAPMQELSRHVMEAMVDDLDRTLREIGVGDMSVGRKVKQMAAAFYGRAAAYDAGLAAGEQELRAAIARNVYAGSPPEDHVVSAIASYLRKAIETVARTGDDSIMSGDIAFPVPD